MRTGVQLSRRRLGRTGMEITQVGLGAWAIGGGGYRYGWGPQDDAASIATILHAVELGINWIDTAAVYGFGHAEEIVGQAVRRLSGPTTPLIFSKCGMRWDPANPMAEPRRDLQPASIRSATSSWPGRCGPSPTGSGPRSERLRSHGLWRGRGSRVRSSAPAHRSRWTDGSAPADCD